MNGFAKDIERSNAVSNLSITTSLTGMPGPHSADPILGPESKFLAGTQKANGDAPGDSYFGVLSPMLPSAPVRPSRRLYDRHSNSNMEESFGQALAEARSEQFSSLGRESTRTPRLEGTEESPYSLPFSPNPLNGAPGLSAPSVSLPPPSIMRPSTPADEAISSADWSVPRKGSPAIGSLASPFTVPGPSPSLGAQSVPSSTRPTSTSQILAATPPNGYLSSASPKALGGGSPQPPPSMASVTTSNKSPSTPIDYSAMSLATPSYGMPELTDMRAFPSLSGSSPQPPAPPSQTSYSSSHSTLPSALDMSRRPPSTSFSAGKSPASPGASRYQYEQSDEDGSEGGAFTHRRQDTGLSSGGSVVGIGGGGHKEKGKIPESIDMALINGTYFFWRACKVFR